MNSVTTHHHCGVLGIGQERYRSGIGDGVDPAQLDIDLEANIREVLRLRLFALVALQALSSYSSLKDLISNRKRARERWRLTWTSPKLVGELSYSMWKMIIQNLLFDRCIYVCRPFRQHDDEKRRGGLPHLTELATDAQ